MNKNNYKNILMALLLMLIALPTAMMAQTSSERYMVVTENDGTVTVFNFDEVQSVTWDVPKPEPEPLPGSFGTGKANINDAQTDVEWIQLWEDGPKFAKYNVGVTDGKAESYGDYYQWGDHIASNVWGTDWRMPSVADFNALINNCDAEWTTINEVNGTKFTGRGEYANNTIFFPAAGRGGSPTTQGEYSYYWSNEIYSGADENSGYRLILYEGYVGTGMDRLHREFSVRAIYDPQPEPEPELLPGSFGTGKANINGAQTDVEWIQLWEDGPKFAKYNVGVTDGKPESFGGIYGGSSDGSSEVLDVDHATSNWGIDWKMLSAAVFTYMLRNCSIELTTLNGVNGIKFTGKGDYSNNSLFFPAAFDNNIIGQYHLSGQPGEFRMFTFNMNQDGGIGLPTVLSISPISVRAIYDRQKSSGTGSSSDIGGKN